MRLSSPLPVAPGWSRGGNVADLTAWPLRHILDGRRPQQSSQHLCRRQPSASLRHPQLLHPLPEAALAGMVLADFSQVSVVAGDLPPLGDAVTELLAALQMVGGMAIAAGAGIGQGEVHHRSQGDGRREWMRLAQLLGGGPQQGVVVSIQLAAALEHEL